METSWWREATLATDVGDFLQRVGTQMLKSMQASAVIVRAVESTYIETVAGIRAGVLGVTYAHSPRAVLTPTAHQRVFGWLEAGHARHVDRNDSASLTRDLMRGLELDDSGWWVVPLAAHSEAMGVLLVAAKPR